MTIIYLSHKYGIMTAPVSREVNQAMRRRGSALVEFALVTPILVVLILLMVQYGLVMNRILILSHAAREAARHAAVRPQDDQGIRNRALGAMQGRRHNPSRLTITIEPAQSSDRRTGQPIRVIVQYDMSDEIFIPTRFFQFFRIQIINPVVRVEATAMIE